MDRRSASEPSLTEAHRLGRRQYAAVADRYATSASHASGEDLVWLQARAKALPASMALDVACGGGFSTRALVAAGHRVTGTDLTPESVVAARGATPPGAARWAVGAAERLPFSPATFGVVACRIAAHHFGDIAAFVAEVRRVLAPHGVFLLIDTVVPLDAGVADWINRVERMRDPSHVRALSVSSWARLARDAGLEIDEERTVRKRHEVEPWLRRSGCVGEAAQAVRSHLDEAPDGVRAEWQLETDARGCHHSFTDTKLCLRASRPG